MGRDIVSGQILAQSFPRLTAEECQELSPYFELRQFSRDTHVMDQGDVGDFMGIILDGKLAIKKGTVYPGKFVLMAILEKGALVGEMAMAQETIRSASVIAVEDSSLLVLSRARAADLFSDNPVIGVKVLRRILKVVGGRLQLATTRLSQLL